MKKRPQKTRLWYVWLGGWKPLTVYVSAKRPSAYYMRIRSITAKAAGRRYIRGNLQVRINTADLETDNPFSPGGGYVPTKEWMKSNGYGSLLESTVALAKTAVVKVV